MMKSTTNKDDADMMKSYAYGGRVADRSMEKPGEMQDGGNVMKPREPYTTKQAAEEERKKNMFVSLPPMHIFDRA